MDKNTKKPDCQFEAVKRQEMGRKIDFYQDRADATFWDLIPMAQFRLSLWSIFGLTDRITLNSQKAKKVKNLL